MISGLVPPFGGVETVVNELSKFFASKGADVTIFGKDEINFVKKTSNSKIIGLRPLDYLPKGLRFAHYPKYAYSFEVWKRIRKEYFDIIHGHGDNCFFPSLFRGKLPFIMTFHGTMRGVYSRTRRLGPRTKPVFYTEKIAALRCDIAIACSNAVKNELVTLYGVNPNKIKVIYNGVDVDKFVPQNKNQAKRNLRLPLKNKYGVWVGTNPSLKGLSIAKSAVKGLRNVHLLIVGVEGENSETASFFGKVYDYKLLLTLYNAADFLIFPTQYEGFPLVPLEAMACGVPIIVSEESNMGEIISEGVHGFVVKERNPLSYRDKIELLINDDKMLDDMRIKCRNLAVNYSWKKQAEKYWKIYLKLLY